MAQTSVINIEKWIEDNKDCFLPPVCNKMMHQLQLKVFYVGGPNQRKDFHMEEGEELFYMKKGDMELIILEQGKFRIVQIKEGEVFLLPGKIPHSPQRAADTMGLVIERERSDKELDCLRYYVEDSVESLFERWFHCEDLGTQLVPVIKEYFASEQHRTGIPIPGTIPENPPYQPNKSLKVEDPFCLEKWLECNKSEISRNGMKKLFEGPCYKSDIVVYGAGNKSFKPVRHEIWLWQLHGESTVVLDNTEIALKAEDSILIPPGKEWQLRMENGENFVMGVEMPVEE